MSSTRHLAIILISLVAGVIGLNLLAGAQLSGLRLDFTQGGLYRLSPATGEVLDGLGEPVRLEFVYSRSAAADIAPLRAHAARVRELLRSIEARAHGGVIVEELEPEPFSETEDEAISAGLEPVERQSGDSVFLGVIGRNAVGEVRTLPFLDPARDARLEYDLVELVAALDRGRPPRLAILSSLGLEGPGEDNPLIAALGRRYDLVFLEPGFTEIPDADALLVLHPPELDPARWYLLDQFMLARGRGLFVADPLAHLALKPDAAGFAPLDAVRASDLGPLGPAWGVRVDTRVVAADPPAGLPVQIVEDGRTRTRSYPLWFAAPPGQLSAALPATAALSRGVNLGSPGVIETSGAETGLTAEPLLTTSAEAGRIDIDIAARSPAPGELLEAHEIAQDAPLALAVRLSGVLPSAFPDGPPAEGDVPLDPAGHRARSDGPAEVILIADADILDPAFFTGGEAGEIIADNLDLMLNLIDALAGDRDLMRLRAKPDALRRMTRVDDLRAEAEARYEAVSADWRNRLAEAESELEALRVQGAATAFGGADPEAAQAAARLRAAVVEAREGLRDVERGLRREVDALKGALVFWTQWVPPLLVALAGVLLAVLRRRRRA